MRIVGIITHFGDGGAQDAIIRVKRGLAARGHGMEVWALYRKSGAYAGEPGTRILLDVEKPSAGQYLTLPFRLFSALRRQRPDSVLTFLPLACLLGQGAARLAGVERRVASQRNPGWSYSAPMRLADRWLGSSGFYKVNVCVSESVRDSFASYPEAYRARLVVVHNGLDWRPSSLEKETARERFGLPADADLAVAVGRLSEQKNYPLLLDAQAGLPDLHLAIAGDGPLAGSLKRQAEELGIAERLHLLGYVDKAEVPDLLRAADLFLQPSRFEGQSNALLQAMQEGLPCLTSDIPPQRETLCGEDGKPAGLLLPAEDAGAWSAALRGLLADAAERERLGGLARERVRAFSLEAMMDGFERALAG